MNKKIVVIDDDRVTLEMLKRILSQNEFQVLGATDGKSGLELVRAEKPDIVISDLLIPKIHGLEVCQKIKEDSELKRTKVMLMTATYKAAAFRRDIQASGAEEYIEKPIDTIELMKKIYRLCIQIAEEEEQSAS
ncbi:MAG: response regulator [Acidobacteriota bacterium]